MVVEVAMRAAMQGLRKMVAMVVMALTVEMVEMPSGSN
jgi:hypothetical protein